MATQLEIDWHEAASYRCKIDAPAGYDASKGPDEQADEVSEALWEAIRAASSETTRYDAEIEFWKVIDDA